ncbi:hypothetical protein M8J77_023560 [Diaphorina citri]|nr:hypothetical protein M8J77_023560 [Diaphorina citri]
MIYLLGTNTKPKLWFLASPRYADIEKLPQRSYRKNSVPHPKTVPETTAKYYVRNLHSMGGSQTLKCTTKQGARDSTDNQTRSELGLETG